MAQRRMFSMKIVDTDAFLDMPQSSQLLYYSLAMRADDDGFISNPKKIMRMIGSQEDDYKILLAKRFVIEFDSGVCVIKHWLIHNLIRGDRYVETQYTREKSQLVVDEKTSKYSLKDEFKTNVIPNDNQTATQVRLGKDRLGEVKLRESSNPSRDFFENPEIRERVIKEFTLKGGNRSLVEKEINKFVYYWTESNGVGTKQRWEREKVFDVERRLATWFSRIKEYQNNQPRKVIKA